MSKISTDVATAFWNYESFSRGNTVIIPAALDGYWGAVMYLHGNEIARVTESKDTGDIVLDITPGGWITATTRNRLRSVIGKKHLGTITMSYLGGGLMKYYPLGGIGDALGVGSRGVIRITISGDLKAEVLKPLRRP